MSQSVCRDFVTNGFCRYGERCKFYHPPKNGGRTFSSANSTPLGGNKQGLKYQFNEDTVRTELQIELPRWTLSSFGAGKYEPNLFSGSDTSPEELKWKSVQALASNNPQGYIQEEDKLTSQAKTTISTALQNLPTTVKLAEKLHDARYPTGTTLGDPRPAGFNEDAILAGGSGPSAGFGQASTSAFGQFSFGSSTGAFGAPTGPKTMTSAFGGSSPAAFGSSSFGQKPGTSAFGSSAFGSSQSAFGSSSQTSAFGKSAFGASTFGQSTSPSAFGAASTPQSAFGSASTPQSPFGTTAPQLGVGASTQSAFGSSAPQSGFGTTPQSGFGTSSTPQSAFGQSGFGAKPLGTAFGSPSALGTTSTPSAFGSSAFGVSSTPSAFEAPSASPSAQPPAPSASTSTPSPGAGFGQSAFGQSSNPSGFGAFSTSPSGTSAFASATPSAFSGFGTASSAFGQPSSTSSFAPVASTSPSFPPDVNVPDGWSYDDPWSYLLPTIDSGPDKLDEADAAAFRSSSFKFDSIPILPPPVALRG